jgi:hypothetical protein
MKVKVSEWLGLTSEIKRLSLIGLVATKGGRKQ